MARRKPKVQDVAADKYTVDSGSDDSRRSGGFDPLFGYTAVGGAALTAGYIAGKKTNIPAKIINRTTKEFTSMPVSKFQKKYNVGSPYEGNNWGSLLDDDGFLEGPVMRRVGAIDGGDMDVLTRDIAERGILTPVKVSGKNVIDGHHRVVAAMNVGKKTKIPIQKIR